MKRIKLLTVVFVGIFTGNMVSAQEQLTLQHALKYALSTKQRAEGKVDVENAQYLINETRGHLAPAERLAGSERLPIIRCCRKAHCRVILLESRRDR